MDNALLDQGTDGKNILHFIKNTDKRGTQNQTLTYLKSRLALLESYWINVFNRHRKLCQNEGDLADEKYFMEDHYTTYEEAYADTKATLMDRIAALDQPGTPASAAIQNPAQLVTTHSSLPKLSLPRFSGEQVEWETFKERFSALVKNDTALGSVLKLQHLLSCLDGEAARRIKSLQLIGSNFSVAWDTLLKRYDNPRVRLSAHMRRLMSMPAATGRSAAEITSLLDGVAEATRAFNLLG